MNEWLTRGPVNPLFTVSATHYQENLELSHLEVVFNSAVRPSAIPNDYFNYIVPCAILKSVVVCQRTTEIAEVEDWPVAVSNEAGMLGLVPQCFLPDVAADSSLRSFYLLSTCADLVGSARG